MIPPSIVRPEPLQKNYAAETHLHSDNSFLQSLEGAAYLQYEPAVDMDFVLRLLGKKQDKKTTRATERRLHKLHDKALQFMQPKVTATIHEVVTQCSDKTVLSGDTTLYSKKLARYMEEARFCVVLAGTIGPEIDAAVDHLIERRRLADAYILDALGSGGVESLVNRFQKNIEEKAAMFSFATGLRFSPGYCDWSITQQHTIFSLLMAENIGIALEPTGLMQPRKSISAVFGIFPSQTAKIMQTKIPCLHCAKKNCIARRVP